MNITGNIGDRFIVGNPEDIMSLFIVEIEDVIELGLSEHYYVLRMYSIIKIIPIN